MTVGNFITSMASEWKIFLMAIAGMILGHIIINTFNVFLKRYLDHLKERRESQRHIFRTLKATRGNTNTQEHKDALNEIDIAFSGRSKKEKSVIAAWKKYDDHLSKTNDPASREADELFYVLLRKMALVIGSDPDAIKKISPKKTDTSANDQKGKIIIEPDPDSLEGKKIIIDINSE